MRLKRTIKVRDWATVAILENDFNLVVESLVKIVVLFILICVINGGNEFIFQYSCGSINVINYGVFTKNLPNVR